MTGVRRSLNDRYHHLAETRDGSSTSIAGVVLSWKLALITVVLILLFIYLLLRVDRHRRRLARRTRESLSEMTATAERSLNAFILIWTWFRPSPLAPPRRVAPRLPVDDVDRGPAPRKPSPTNDGVDG